MRGRSLAEAAALLALYEVGFRILGGLPFRGSPRAAVILAAVVALLFVASIVTIANGFALRPRDLPPRAIGWRRSAGPIALAMSALGAAALALRLADPRYDDVEFALRGLGAAATLRALAAAVPFLVAAEEILFRACQERLRHAIGGPASAVAIGLAFALHHVEPGWATAHGAETLVTTLAGGLIFAALYEKIGSVTILIAAHLAYDLFALAQAWLNVNRMRGLEAGLFVAWLLGALAMAYFVRGERR